MAGWHWLTKPDSPYTPRFALRVVIKATLLFLLLNAVYAVVQPLPFIQQFSLYNTVIDGRPRFPYADNPTEVYNLSIDRLEGMFAAHHIDGAAHRDDTFRVLMVGDSGVWGWLLTPDQTFSSCLNRGDFLTSDERRVDAYNLGYPIMNVLKDFMMMDYALRYEPDAIVWFVTLEGMFDSNQLEHPILRRNQARVRDLIATYDLSLDINALPAEPTLLEQSIVGQRRELADWLRLQTYGLAWSVTGYDHTNPIFDRAPVSNFPPNESIPNRDFIAVGDPLAPHLALDVIEAAITRAAQESVPVLLVNEPIFIGDGQNSDLRYNDFYPRWAYDQYRELMQIQAVENNWRYVDLWNFVPAERFTDFPLHYDAEYTCRVAERLVSDIIALAP